MACEILVPQPGIEPGPSAVEAQSSNHWTAREFLIRIFRDFVKTLIPGFYLRFTKLQASGKMPGNLYC